MASPYLLGSLFIWEMDLVCFLSDYYAIGG